MYFCYFYHHQSFPVENKFLLINCSHHINQDPVKITNIKLFLDANSLFAKKKKKKKGGTPSDTCFLKNIAPVELSIQLMSLFLAQEN